MKAAACKRDRKKYIEHQIHVWEENRAVYGYGR